VKNKAHKQRRYEYTPKQFAFFSGGPAERIVQFIFYALAATVVLTALNAFGIAVSQFLDSIKGGF
jgi:hypothetical protein